MSLTTSLTKNKLNLFYILVFIPLLPIQYFGYIARGDLFAAIIPLYAFLLLIIKKEKLSALTDNGLIHRLIGLILMSASFFIYYAVVFFYPQAQFYGVANYTVYLIGLFLAFFQVPALKESFTPLFLIVAATASGFVGKWMEFLLEPYVPFFVQIMAFILKFLCIPSAVAADPTIIILHTPERMVPVPFEAGCIGIYSFLTFAIVIVVTMMEDPSSLRTKVLWSTTGIIGTFFVNIIRVSLIAAVVYYFGYKDWAKIHTPIGYVLFIAWLAIFFLTFSQRQAILNKLQTSWQSLRRSREVSAESLL